MLKYHGNLNRQAFRWIKTDTDEYACAFHKRLIVLKQTPTDIQFFAHPQDQEAMHAWLHNYFQLAVDLDKLYDEWSTDGNFKKKAAWFHGIRMLRQDPVENVFSFICSSNNNIPRITQMVQLLTSLSNYTMLIVSHDLDPQPVQTLWNTHSYIQVLGLLFIPASRRLDPRFARTRITRFRIRLSSKVHFPKCTIPILTGSGLSHMSSEVGVCRSQNKTAEISRRGAESR